nr:hypothetical protein BaRGS_031503 [Batillaria attramentaria]
MMMEMRMIGGTNMHKMMSFYEYDAEEPDLFKFDIATCYGPTQSKNIAFFVPGRYIDIVAGDVKLFKYFVMMSIQAYTSVSPLRISRLDLQEAGDNVLVTFDLLDKAPLSGDIPNPPREVTLNDAYTLLVNGINNGKLQILMQKNDVSDLRILTAKPAPAQFQFHSSSRARRSAANPSTSSSGYSGGAMGGMAVGMLVLGALLGFGIMFVVYKVRGGSFSRTGGGIGMKRFENDREQVAGPDGES